LAPRNPIRECSSKYERRDVPQGQEGEYLALAPGNPDQLALAIYLFGAIGIGIKKSAEDRHRCDAAYVLESGW
jgi:hypothetical protein